MSKVTKSVEERLDNLEEAVEDIETPYLPDSLIKVIAVIAIWVSAAAICFSPPAREHFEEVVGAAVAGTFIVAMFFD